MNHSLLSADRTTHIKIVVVALVCAIMIVVAGIASHLTGTDAVAGVEAHGPVVKAGASMKYTGHNGAAVR